MKCEDIESDLTRAGSSRELTWDELIDNQIPGNCSNRDRMVATVQEFYGLDAIHAEAILVEGVDVIVLRSMATT